MGDFHSRKLGVHTDGTPDRYTKEDAANEARGRAILEVEWNCQIKEFGRMCPVDWYCLRDERMVAVAELKTRSHASTQYPTVFLNLRKWLCLSTAELGLGVPAVFAAQFTDAIYWISLSEIDARNKRMGGCGKKHAHHTDIEPVIEVPIAKMYLVSPKTPK